MQVIRIDNIPQFDQLKTDWERIYAADSCAHIYMSWVWLRGWFEITPYSWMILAVRADNISPYTAFFPLIVRGLYFFNPIRILYMGGSPLAVYTGFICLPEYEEDALAALAVYVKQQLSWDSFYMEDVLDPRLDLFTKHFAQEKFDIRQVGHTPSLYITLPETWEQYLKDYLGRETRRSLRRSFKKVESLNEFHITQAQNGEGHIKILLSLWQRRWGPKPRINWYRDILNHLSEHHHLWSGVLWDGTTPMAALAGFVDQSEKKKTFYAYIVGHNPKYAKLSPGKVMIAYSIQYAIKNGFQIYEFLTGLGTHKLAFGPNQHATTTLIITRKGLKSSIANKIVDFYKRISEILKRRLGKLKRISLVKKVWFWLLARFK